MKKKPFLTIALLLLIIVIVVVCYFINSYNRKTPDAGEVQVEITMGMDEFVDAFESFEDEDAAMKHYNGKVIRLMGEISTIAKNGETMDITFKTNDPVTGVNANLVSDMIPKIKKYKSGDSVTIQGFVTGKLIDIELNRAVIVE